MRYEDLKRDVMTQLKRMLEFLEIPYSKEAVEKRMRKTYDNFHRRHDDNDFDYYTFEQREYVIGQVQEAVELMRSRNNGVTYGIEEYLQN